MSDSLAAAGDDRNLRSAVEYIARIQRPDGRIPWHAGGPADPWDHVESAMGLTVGRRDVAATEAYRWLADRQLDDGSWWAVYGSDGRGERSHRETHRTGYVATGVWHHYLTTADQTFLEELWPTVNRALNFVVDRQWTTGEIPWAVDADGAPVEGALLTGCSSLALSLECGHRIATTLGYERPGWRRSREALVDVIRRPADALETRWLDKREFAMDWFYPVLSGVVTGSVARERLAAREASFVEPGLGCRCDRSETWVTVAETAELVMAMLAAGREARAAELFEWATRFRDAEGAFWTGYQFVDDELWPAERPTWTAGAVLLAADALDGLTPAADLFTDHG